MRGATSAVGLECFAVFVDTLMMVSATRERHPIPVAGSTGGGTNPPLSTAADGTATNPSKNLGSKTPSAESKVKEGGGPEEGGSKGDYRKGSAPRDEEQPGSAVVDSLAVSVPPPHPSEVAHWVRAWNLSSSLCSVIFLQSEILISSDIYVLSDIYLQSDVHELFHIHTLAHSLPSGSHSLSDLLKSTRLHCLTSIYCTHSLVDVQLLCE